MHLLLLTLWALFVARAHCWGSLGHRTVAYLAQQYMTPTARIFVDDLINHQDISEAALWPDKVRHMPPFHYSASWHFIDAQDDPPGQCGLNFTRDCPSSQEGGCIVSAITNHTERILNASLWHWERGQSMRYLLHFLGDIHQPLHTEHEERGGNDIPVLFGGVHTNLHSVWDTRMPNKIAHPDPKACNETQAAWDWANELYKRDPHPNVSLGTECQDLSRSQHCSMLWAGDANKFVCTYILKDDVEGVLGKNLAAEYYDGAVPIIEEMVGKAGRRLGAWINAMVSDEYIREIDHESPLVIQG